VSWQDNRVQGGALVSIIINSQGHPWLTHEGYSFVKALALQEDAVRVPVIVFLKEYNSVETFAGQIITD
jgi:hypothetical protein